MYLRQGDVVLEKVPKAKGKQTGKKKLVLAEGEVTGHFHILECERPILESFEGEERYIELEEDSVLTHQEHDTVTIPKGSYKVKLQREVDLAGEVRQVMD